MHSFSASPKYTNQEYNMSSHDYGDNSNAILVEDNVGDNSDEDTLGFEDYVSSSSILILLLLICILAAFFFGGSFCALLIRTSHLSDTTHLVRMLGSTIAYFLSLWPMDRFFRILAGVLGTVSAIIAALIVSAVSNLH